MLGVASIALTCCEMGHLTCKGCVVNLKPQLNRALLLRSEGERHELRQMRVEFVRVRVSAKLPIILEVCCVTCTPANWAWPASFRNCSDE